MAFDDTYFSLHHHGSCFNGLKGAADMVSALIIGGVEFMYSAFYGRRFVADLKIGYWLGTTPAKQQGWKFLGTLICSNSR